MAEQGGSKAVMCDVMTDLEGDVNRNGLADGIPYAGGG